MLVVNWLLARKDESDGERPLLMNVYFVDIGGIVDHLCLEVVVSFVDIGWIVDHHSLEVIVSFVDIGGIIVHHCL